MQEQTIKSQMIKCPTAETLQSQGLKLSDRNSNHGFVEIPPLQFSKTKKSQRRKIFNLQTERFQVHNKQTRGSFEQFDRGIGIDLSMKNRRIKSQRPRHDVWKSPNCQNKILPENLKIIYYGPINTSISTKKNLPLNSQAKTVTNLKKVHTDHEQETLIQQLELQSRYYDRNATKIYKDSNIRKANLTYFNLEQQIKKQSSMENRKVPLEYIFYGMLLLVGVLFLIAFMIK